MKLFFILTYFFSFILTLQSQNLKEDLLIMSKLYVNLDKFKLTTVVENYTNGNLISSNKYDIWKWGEQFVQKNKDYDVILNDKFLIIVTRPDKHISFAYAEDIPNNDKKDLLVNANFDKIVDNYFEKYDSVKFNGLVNGKNFYRIYSSEFQAKWLDLSFDINTHLIYKLVYYFDTKESFSTVDKMILTFNHKKLDTYPTSIFNHNNYIKISTNKVSVASKYKEYSISQKNYFGQ